jgi:dihydrodipicolinate synthase/N-acetylneuraminate lyase
MLANFRGGPNPVPVKAALAAMGLIATDTLRRPLRSLEPTTAAPLHGILRDLGLIEVGGGRISTVRPAESVA